jgi:CBS-domain-containing membrane protein
MIVKDLMTTDVISVSPEEKIEQVASILTEKRIHGVPVVDDKNRLIGIITETDFFIKDCFNFHLPSYIDFIKNTKFSGGLGYLEKQKIKKIVKAIAKDIMSTKCITVSSEDGLDKLLALIKENDLHTIPVVDSSGKVEGIIARSDLIKMITA